MKSYAYLLINFFTLSIPLIYTFHPKLRFDKRWSAYWPAMLLVGLVFLIWDEFFTRNGVWGFNPDYLIGVTVFHLPLEEILFFICIPYACVFTYHCLIQLQINPLSMTSAKWVSSILVILLTSLAIIHYERAYTVATFTLLVLTLIYLQWIKNKDLSPFYFAYAILLIPFAVTNGILTGSFIENEIVWYNDAENMSIRIGTIPIEDIFYGMLLILWNVCLMEYFTTRLQSSNSTAG